MKFHFLEKKFSQFFQKSPDFKILLLRLGKSGEFFWAKMQTYNKRDATLTFCGYYAFIMDIFKRKLKNQRAVHFTPPVRFTPRRNSF